VQILNVSKPLSIKLVGSKGSSITVAAEDRLSLDVAGVEFEHRASGQRRFIPWSQIAEMTQPL
jgi:hypothetical protein